MTEQEAIAGAVLNTPEPDRLVDCGESRPLPVFHMSTLMQYGERCAEAALAWLRSQGEPIGEMSQDERGEWSLHWTRAVPYGAKLYITPIESSVKEYQQTPVAWMNASGSMIISAEAKERLLSKAGLGGEFSCAAVTAARYTQPLFLAPQPAIPDGWQLVPKEPTKAMIDNAGKEHGYPGGDRSIYAKGYRSMLAATPEPTK